MHQETKKTKEPNILPKACEGNADVGSLEPMKASGNEPGCELTGNLNRGYGTVLLRPISREKKKIVSSARNLRKHLIGQFSLNTGLWTFTREKLPFPSFSSTTSFFLSF